MGGVDVIDVTQIRGIRNAVSGTGKKLRRQQSLKAGRERLERDGHGRAATSVPASGPGVCSKIVVARNRMATAGQMVQPLVPMRNTDALEIGAEPLPLFLDHAPLVVGCRPDLHEDALDRQARSSTGRAKPTATARWPSGRERPGGPRPRPGRRSDAAGPPRP